MGYTSGYAVFFFFKDSGVEYIALFKVNILSWSVSAIQYEAAIWRNQMFLLQSSSELRIHNIGTTWKFNAPAASLFGGLWEKKLE